MQEFASKFTFGFLMAQFLPGAVTVYAISFAFWARWIEPTTQLLQYVKIVGEKWFSLPTLSVIFVFLSIAVGMLTHGVHWVTLAWLENGRSRSSKPVRAMWWHQRWIGLQLSYAPLAILIELVSVLFAPELDDLTMDENVPCLSKDQFQCFTFLQDFYLHFGQFYAHMAYALLVGIACFVWTCSQRGWTCGRFELLLGLYVLVGVQYLLGRVTLGSLFDNEKKFLSTPAGTSATPP